jgi:hypothetical protein
MSFWDGSRWTVETRADPEPRRNGVRSSRARDAIATLPVLLLVPALVLPFMGVGARSAALSVAGHALAGGTVTVAGTGFPGRQTVQLSWDGTTVGMPSVDTSPAGRFTVQLSVPIAATPGPHTLAAFASSSGRSGARARADSGRTDATTTVTVLTATPPAATTAAPTAIPPAPITPNPPDSDQTPRPPDPTPAPTDPTTQAPDPTQTPDPTQRPPDPTQTPDPTPPPPDPTPEPDPALNVRDFGATGNGSTNDTAAFRAAIEASLGRGKVVYVPDGTYMVSRLVLPQGLTLRGESRDNTILRRHGLGEHAAGGFIHIENAANVTIEHMTLRGTGRRLSDSGVTGRGDDILINVINGRGVTARDLTLRDAQGCGIQTEGAETYGGLYTNISIINTYVRDNGNHGVALWPYRGTHQNTFRHITIDGADYAGIMIDAGTTVGPASSVNENLFEDIVIRNAARYHLADGGTGAGWIWTGGRGNRVEGYEITDIPQGAALAFGSDQSGIGSTLNTLVNGRVVRIASGTVAAFGGGATENTFNGGSGSGTVSGVGGNIFKNWPGLLFQ